MKKEQLSLSTKTLYAEPKCDAVSIASMVICASDGNQDLNPKDETDPWG